jgi:hypothetical protein
MDGVNSSSCDCPAMVPHNYNVAALRVLVLVAAHPKLWSLVQFCALSILSLWPKPSLAHYPLFIVCLETNLFKK